MIIRSNDGQSLVNTDNICYIHYFGKDYFNRYGRDSNTATFRRLYYIEVKCLQDNVSVCLGTYKSEERVKEIMDEIAQKIAAGCDFYNMPNKEEVEE